MALGITRLDIGASRQNGSDEFRIDQNMEQGMARIIGGVDIRPMCDQQAEHFFEIGIISMDRLEPETAAQARTFGILREGILDRLTSPI